MSDGSPGPQITDEVLDRVRRRIGVPSRWMERPRNTVVTPDALRDFAIGYGDDNPLYTDERYGQGTRWDGPIGAPLFPLSCGVKAATAWTEAEAAVMGGGDPLRGIGQYLSSESWQFLAPIVPGVKLYKTRHLHDVAVRESELTGSRVAILTNRVMYADADHRLYAINDRTYHHAEKKKSAERGKYKTVERTSYTDDEIEAIEAAYAAETRRGAAKRTFAEVNVGDVLPTVVKGPLTVTDIIYYHLAIGMGGIAGPMRLAHQSRMKTPGYFSRNAFNIPDLVQRCHWEDDYAQALGQPAAYDYGMMRTNWMAHVLTDWMGDDAWVSRLSAEIRRFNYMGDTHWMSGTVTAIDGAAVEIALEGVNQRGETTCLGDATVLLCAADGTPPTLPVVSADLSSRCSCAHNADQNKGVLNP